MKACRHVVSYLITTNSTQVVKLHLQEGQFSSPGRGKLKDNTGHAIESRQCTMLVYFDIILESLLSGFNSPYSVGQ